MSYTTIKGLYPPKNKQTSGEKYKEVLNKLDGFSPTEDVDIEQLRNSWGSAPVIWNVMAKKYLKTDSWAGYTDKLWPLYRDEQIPAYLRAVHLFTFDRFYVSKKDYARLAKDIRQFVADFPTDATQVNHWPRIATLLESDPDYPAIGLYCTSVAEDPWKGPWNEESEEYGSFDWSTANDLYYILDVEVPSEKTSTENKV